MKSYTDLEQSKKLAEILPPESADMCWGICDETLKWKTFPYLMPWRDYTAKEHYLPCWSLAALLNVYPMVVGEDLDMYCCWQNRKNLCSKHYDNPVDACYEMILKLHEEKLL